jgi:transglutaminase-like putative cysteine protease
MHRIVTLAAALAAVAGCAHAAPDDPHPRPAIVDGPEPAWVKPVAAADAPRTASPIALLLVDRQTLLDGARSATEIRLAVRADSPQGLVAATVRLPLLPSYATIVLHEARLIRDGVEVARLKAGQFQWGPADDLPGLNAPDVLWNASAHFEGMRVGDTVEVAYTVAGAAPDGQRRSARIFLQDLAADQPAPARLSQRIVWPAGDSVTTVRSADAPDLTSTVSGPWRELVWDKAPLEKEPAPEPGAPVTALRPPFIEVSEYGSWGEVASSMGALQEPLLAQGAAARQIAAEIRKAASDPAVQVVAALRRVQDDVAYYEVGLARGGYTPRPPDETWRTRWGDCKDKAVLFVAILRALGIDAVPAAVQVVSSAGAGAVSPREAAPSPAAFNHEIARVTVGGKVYWLDPTDSLQRGPLDSIEQFEDGWALPLRPGVTDLERIEPPAHRRPSVYQDMVYDFASTPGALTVSIRRTERAGVADAARQWLNLGAPDKLQAHYADLLAAPGDDWTSKPRVSSDDGSGDAVVTAEQLVSSPFVTRRLGKRDVQVFYDAERIAKNLPMVAPGDGVRKLPMQVSRRYSYEERIEVDLAAGDKLLFTPRRLETAAFAFDSRIEKQSSTGAILHYSIRAKTDEVPASDAAAEAAAIKTLSDLSPVVVTRPLPKGRRD